MARPSTRGMRRGNAAVTIVALLPALGFAALAVDLGSLHLARAELQVAADAAVLAGVGHLDGTDEGLERALRAARLVAAENTVLGEPTQLSGDALVPGTYSNELDQFVATTDPALVDALYVSHDATGLNTVFAGAAFGRFIMETHVESIARAGATEGAGEVPCFLPVAVPDCLVGQSGAEDLALQFSSANEDNAGWGRLAGSPNASYVRTQLQGQCDSGPAVVGDEVGLQNGVIASGMSELRVQIDGSDTRWDTARWGEQPPPMGSESNGGGSDSKSTVTNYGNTLEGPVLLFTPDGGVCGSSAQFNGYHDVSGFAWGVIYDVDDKGAEQNMRMKLDLDYEYEEGTGGGGIDAGVVYRTDSGLVY